MSYPPSETSTPAASPLQVFIYGVGGHGRVIRDFFYENKYEVVFVDDSGAPGAISPNDLPDGATVVLGIGDNKSREKIFSQLKSSEKKLIFPVALHWSVHLSGRASLDEGVVLCANSVICTGARLGKGVIVNTSATVDHDCVIGDFAHIAPGVNLCGAVSIGDGTLIGVGSAVIPGISIGAGSVIGAGAVVVEDIPSKVLAVGNPCRVIRSL